MGQRLRVDRTLRWLIGVFLLCVLLVFSLRGYFTDQENKLRTSGDNERAHLLLGKEIVRSIQGVETGIYRLASSPNAAELKRISQTVNAQLDKLQHDLNALQTGGPVSKQLGRGGQGALNREATYQPDEQGRVQVMEMIEIGSQLGQVRDQAEALGQLLPRRWQALEAEDRAAFFQAELDIAALLNQAPLGFERLHDNAHRLFVEGDQRLRLLEVERQSQHGKLEQTESSLIALVLVLGGIAGLLLMQRLTTALGEARTARDEIEGQREQNATMLDTLSDGVYATDLKGDITFLNAAAEKILGWTAQELVGQQAHQAIHHTRPNGEPFPRAQCPLISVLREGASLDGEDHFVGHDGRFIPVSYRTKPLMRDGEVVGSLVSFQDISERIDSEARIRLQRAALDAAANMIVITDRTGRIEYVNQAFCTTTGYTAEEAIGQQPSLLKSDRHDAAFYQGMWHALLGGQPWEGELFNRCKDGRVYSEQMTITPIIEGGTITHFVAIKRDISEQTRTRTRLKLIETAIQEIEQGILISDAQPDDNGPTIQYVNSGFSRITGFSCEAAVGQRTGILRGPQTDPVKTAQFKEAMLAGESITLEMNYRHQDGRPYIAELHYAPVHDEQGKLTHYIGLLSDIGPRKEVEAALRNARDQALENSRLKSEFLSTMSHEIRTPMNGIIGMSDLLLDTPLNPEQREFAGIVHDSANALLTIINDILDFSKIEAGKLDIEITDFSPLNVVEGTVDLLAAKAREKKLSLMSFVDPHLPKRLRGDPTRLRQVLLNLISNAVKFTEHGTIELSARQEQHNGEPRVRFEVRDSGIGIPEATQARLFQSFTQADSSTTRKYGGTGLGLAISKRLVELMGGEIGVTSAQGQGSTFWFTLALKPSAELAASAPAAMEPVVYAHNLRVLVVDDHSSDRKIIHRYLTSWGMVSDGASNAMEALKLMRDAADIGTPYEIVLIDFAMPGMDGIELASAIRQEPTFDNTRLVLLSAYDQRDLYDRARTTGFAACLSKPVHQSQLFDSITGHSDGIWNTDAVESLAQTPFDPHLPGAPTHQHLILLAEDNLTNQKVAQLQINKLGYALHIVGNGQDAVEAAEALPYAAILMDCQMPVMDGFEAAAAIRLAEHSGTTRIPIIAMTANAMQGDRERCLAVGMDDYVSKPISPEQLGSVLLKWVGPPTQPDTAPNATPRANGPAPTPEPVSALVDFDLLNDYFGDDPQVLRELLDLFCSSTEVLMGKLQGAIAQRDANLVNALAHEAKGACGNLGIVSMADLSAQLEVAATEADWAHADALGVDLLIAFQRVNRAIETQRQTPPG